jgi:vancomycin aglycone glucosyltransferase
LNNVRTSPELETFVDAGEPPVYLGFGSVRAPADFTQVLIQAARSSCTTAAPARPPRSARFGASQVVMPQMYDQFYWAQRVEHLGIGSVHPPVTP